MNCGGKSGKKERKNPDFLDGEVRVKLLLALRPRRTRPSKDFRKNRHHDDPVRTAIRSKLTDVFKNFGRGLAGVLTVDC